MGGPRPYHRIGGIDPRRRRITPTQSGESKTMHSTIKQGYVAPSAMHTAVTAVTLGTVSKSGEPAAGYHF